MTDHRAVEREAMRREFDAHKLVEKEIAPDGHCLFAAVADQLVALGIDLNCPAVAAAGGGEEKDGEGEEGYKLVRKAAAGYILLHQDEYACFLAADDEVEAGGVEAYAKRIRDTAEWGGQLELAALANAYGVEIRVVQGAGRVEVIAPSGGEEEEGRKTVWLAYYRHGYGLGEHYNSLRKG
jgi:OTU domain-containing protein 6